MLVRQASRIAKQVATLTKRRHLLKNFAVTYVGLRNVSTGDIYNNSFESSVSHRSIVELSPNPFENIAIRRYTTREHDDEEEEESPNPFENIARVRRPKLPPNVIGSPFTDMFIPDITISEYVWSSLNKWPNKTAIVCGISGRGYTYSELRTACRRFAGSLLRAGFEPGQVLAIVLPNTPEYAVAMLGAVEAGLVVTTVNPNYVSAEIAKQLCDSSPGVIVTCPDKYQDVLNATRIAGGRGYVRPIVVVVPSPTDKKVPSGATAFTDLIESECEECRRLPTVDSNSIAVIPYSSGTTGLPKGVCLTHRNLVANMIQIHGPPELCVTRPTTESFQEIVPAVLPFYHIYGMNCILLGKLQVGVKIVTLPKFEKNSFLDVLKNQKATLLFLVPPLVLFMGSSKEVTSEHLRHVRYVASGAAPLGEKDVERFMKKAPLDLQFIQGYGMTETAPAVLTLPPGSNKLASVGQVMPNTRVKIIDVKTGGALGPGEVGEVCCQGPQNMVGYYNNPKATAEMIDEEGWLHTGDLGYYDNDHDFFIVDRLKELIKVKGYQVAPAELEELLRSHPGVLDAAVIGIPDPRAGELPLAYVVPQSAGSADPVEVMEFVAGQVSTHKYLAGVRLVDTIPKSPAGKILRKLLRDEYAKELEITGGARVHSG